MVNLILYYVSASVLSYLYISVFRAEGKVVNLIPYFVTASVLNYLYIKF